MLRIICDACQKEVNDKEFKFEGVVREIKHLLLSGNSRPQLIEKVLNLCQKCYKDKINL